MFEELTNGGGTSAEIPFHCRDAMYMACVYVLVCMLAYVWAHMSVDLHVDARCLLQFLSTLLFERGSLTKPEAH